MMKVVTRRWSTLAGVLLATTLAMTGAVPGPASAAPNRSATTADATATSALFCIPAVGGYFCHISEPSTPIRWQVNGTPVPAWDDLSAGSGGCGPGWPMVVEVTMGDDITLTNSFTCLG